MHLHLSYLSDLPTSLILLKSVDNSISPSSSLYSLLSIFHSTFSPISILTPTIVITTLVNLVAFSTFFITSTILPLLLYCHLSFLPSFTLIPLSLFSNSILIHPTIYAFTHNHSSILPSTISSSIPSISFTHYTITTTTIVITTIITIIITIITIIVVSFVHITMSAHISLLHLSL